MASAGFYIFVSVFVCPSKSIKFQVFGHPRQSEGIHGHPRESLCPGNALEMLGDPRDALGMP